MPSQGHMEGGAMIVKRKDKRQKYKPIGKLLNGAVFEFNGIVMMRIFNAMLDDKVRAVDVENGSDYIFDSNTEVLPLDAELVIRGEFDAD